MLYINFLSSIKKKIRKTLKGERLWFLKAGIYSFNGKKVGRLQMRKKIK